MTVIALSDRAAVMMTGFAYRVASWPPTGQMYLLIRLAAIRRKVILMDGFDKFLAWYRAVLTGMVSVSAVFIQEFLQSSNLPFGRLGQVTLIIISAVLFVQIMELLAQFLVEKSRWLRKTMLGRAYFEGIGVDITFDPATRMILYGTITRFYYSNSRLMAEGEVFDLHGELLGQFELRTFDYSETGLRYGFEGILHVGASQQGKYYGYGEMRFGTRDGNPTKYYGFYIDNSDLKQLYFEGELIDKKTIRQIEKDSEARRRFLKSSIEEFSRRRGYELSEAAGIHNTFSSYETMDLHSKSRQEP